jgi:hypothetical protein
VRDGADEARGESRLIIADATTRPGCVQIRWGLAGLRVASEAARLLAAVIRRENGCPYHAQNLGSRDRTLLLDVTYSQNAQEFGEG